MDRRLTCVSIPRRAQLIRVLYCEIGRLLSHLLQITTAARYFPRYTLCVTPPAGARRCGSFPVLRGAADSGYGTVRLSTFGTTGAGTYRAQWRIGSGPLGPTLRVRV